MTRLTPSAKHALDALNDKHLAYTIAKTTIEAELKRELTERLAVFRHERDMAIKLAADSGVPKTTIGRTIGTSNYRTVQEILAYTDSMLNGSTSQESKKVVVTPEGDYYRVSINDIDGVSGSGVFQRAVNELIPIEGDSFVLPRIYRAGLLDEVLKQIDSLVYA